MELPFFSRNKIQFMIIIPYIVICIAMGQCESSLDYQDNYTMLEVCCMIIFWKESNLHYIYQELIIS